MIWGSGLFTGLFWLLIGLTGAISWIEKVTTKPVVRGIMLGLGLSFIVEGWSMMRELALVVRDIKLKKQNLFVLLVTSGTAMWNMGVAYLAGLILYYGLQRRLFKV
jgi:xanthine/uracil/vitamin C permease (AzgA family)